MTQLITPNPHIPCKPGWCLAYVNEAFGVTKRFGSATAAWFGSSTQHRDRNFPAGVWIPVWYGIEQEPLGHVVLLAPDGSCYSTSDLSNKPYHHPNLAHLEAFYAYYGMTLTYRGWTEDVEGTPVIDTSGSLSYASETITPQEDTLSAAEVASIIDANQKMHDTTRQFLADRVRDAALAVLDGSQAQEDVTRDYLKNQTQAQSDVTRQYLADRIRETSPAEVAALIPLDQAQAFIDALAAQLAK